MEANLNFLPALIDLSIFDAIDEIYHRCDFFFNRTDYPLILTSLNTSTLSQPYYQSYVSCYTNNIGNYLSANHLQYNLDDDIARKIAYPFDAYKPWILPVASIGLFFACLNIRLYMKKKDLRTTFGTLALLQSIATIVFFGFVIGVVFCYYAKFGLLGIM